MHDRYLLRGGLVGLVVMLIGAGCGAPPEQSALVAPSPTIAVLISEPVGTLVALDSPVAAPMATTAASAAPVAPTVPAGQASLEEGDVSLFAYQWPDYLPAGMAPAPVESRIAREGEIGDGGVGFYLVTFNNGPQKLVIGGGAVEPFSLSGPIERVRLGARGARIVTQENQILAVIDDGAPGTLFVFGVGLERAELLRVTESLTPIDVRDLRQRVGVAP